MARRHRIERARAALRLVLVTDRALAAETLVDAVGRALDGGVTTVMMREKDASHEARLELGTGLLAACRRRGALFVVNGDVRAAAALGADGVHLGFDAPPLAAAREALGEEALVGRSTHDLAEVADALASGADYVTFGPVRDTPSKRGRLEPRGFDVLREAVAAAAGVPVVALGGLEPADAGTVRATGAAGVAAIRALLPGGRERAAAAAFARAWEGAAGSA